MKLIKVPIGLGVRSRRVVVQPRITSVATTRPYADGMERNGVVTPQVNDYVAFGVPCIRVTGGVFK